ncbi:MAG: AAA family ATPase [Thermaerobacter sp.]|nr:AAA family ATPase [Thermaerobacter sp.]
MLGRSPLVGRAAELKCVAAALDRTAGGQGGVLFLAGEAGIGKTRLAEESMRLALRRGFRTLSGRSGPLEQGLAYALILDVFGPFLRAMEPAHRRLLVSGLPHLGQLFSDLGLPPPSPLGEPGLEKTQLFEAVARLLERLAEETPLALFLDDLHWADTSSLELLHRLARVLEGRAVLLMGTLRPRESEERREVRALVQTIRRGQTWIEELAVPPLDPAEAADMVAALLEGEVSADLQHLLAVRSGGWPLFVDALVRSAIETGKLARSDGVWYLRNGAALPLPANLLETVRDWLDRSNDAEQQVLALVAVAGRDATHRVLAEVGGLNEATLLRTLQRLETAGLLAERPHGRTVAYTFMHPLFQEVVYDKLPLAARQQTHTRVAAAIETIAPDDIEALARHYGKAGPEMRSERALHVLLTAGEQAWAVHAYEEAAHHWRAALEQARTTWRHDLVPEILERLGEAWTLLGQGTAAVVIWQEALDIKTRVGDARGAARLCRRLALTEWDLGRLAEARQHLMVGLELLKGTAASLEHAELQHARTVFCRRLGDVDGAGEAAGALAVLASQLRSVRCEAMAQLARSGVALANGAFGEALTSAADGLAAAQQAEDTLLTVRARDVLGLLAFAAGSHRLVRRLGADGIAQARTMELPRLEVQPRLHTVLAQILAGDWDDALSESARAIVLARRHGPPRILAVGLGLRSLLLAYRGDLNEAEAAAAEAEQCYHADGAVGSHERPVAVLARAIVALEKGQAARASELTVAFLKPPALAASPFCLSVLAEASARRGDTAEVETVVGRLNAFGLAGSAYAAALALRAAAHGRQAAGRCTEAMVFWEQAISAFDTLGLPFEVARARSEWAALARRERPDAARDAALAGWRTFTALGARRYAEDTRRFWHDLGVRFPAPRPPRPGSLSLRELEVARLVADGMTNVQVAARLNLSARTVENHLQRIYERLQLPSRAALARYLAEHGLTEKVE